MLDGVRDRSSGTNRAYLEAEYANQARSNLETVQNLFSLKDWWRGPEGLTQWLSHGFSCETSDPRDRIFAFLGLASSGYNIEPDYSPTKSLEALLIEITSKIMEFDKDLFFLKRLENNPENSGCRDLLSWVPDWTKKNDTRAEQRAHRLFDDQSLQRFMGVKVDPDLFSRFAPTIMPGGILKLEGFLLDTFGDVKAFENIWGDKELKIRKGILVTTPLGITIRPEDGIWYFPAAGPTFILILRPNNGRWTLLAWATLCYVFYYRSLYILRLLKDAASLLVSLPIRRNWAAKIYFRLRDHNALIKMSGVKREVVYIC